VGAGIAWGVTFLVPGKAAEDDPRVLAAALGDVAHTRGMAQLARKTGMTREAR